MASRTTRGVSRHTATGPGARSTVAGDAPNAELAAAADLLLNRGGDGDAVFEKPVFRDGFLLQNIVQKRTDDKADLLSKLRKRSVLRELTEDAVSALMLKEHHGLIASHLCRLHRELRQLGGGAQAYLYAHGSYVPYAYLQANDGARTAAQSMPVFADYFSGRGQLVPPRDIDLTAVPLQALPDPADMRSRVWGAIDRLRDEVQKLTYNYGVPKLKQKLRAPAEEIRAELQKRLDAATPGVTVADVQVMLFDANDMAIKMQDRRMGAGEEDVVIIRRDVRRVVRKDPGQARLPPDEWRAYRKQAIEQVRAQKMADEEWCAKNMAHRLRPWSPQRQNDRFKDKCYPLLTSFNDTIDFAEIIPHPLLPGKYYKFRKDFELLRLGLNVRVKVRLQHRGEEFEVRTQVPAYFVDVSILRAGDAKYAKELMASSWEGLDRLSEGTVPYDGSDLRVHAPVGAPHAPLPHIGYILETSAHQLAYYNNLLRLSNGGMRPDQVRTIAFIAGKKARLARRIVTLPLLEMLFMGRAPQEMFTKKLTVPFGGERGDLTQPIGLFKDVTIVAGEGVQVRFKLPVPSTGLKLPAWVPAPHTPQTKLKFLYAVWASALLASMSSTHFVRVAASVVSGAPQRRPQPRTAQRGGHPASKKATRGTRAPQGGQGGEPEWRSRPTASWLADVWTELVEEGGVTVPEHMMALMAEACCEVFGPEIEGVTDEFSLSSAQRATPLTLALPTMPRLAPGRPRTGQSVRRTARTAAGGPAARGTMAAAAGG